MKNYKEINENIVVSRDLKEKTLKRMTTTQKRPYLKIGAMAMVCTMVLCVGIASFMHKEHTDTTKPKEARSFDLHTYVMDIEPKTGWGGYYEMAKDISGRMENMSEKLLEKTMKDVPALDQLKFPKGYTSSIQFLEYHNDDMNIGPYANVFYTAEIEGEYMIMASVYEKDMPQCMPMHEDVQWKTYKDYRLIIYHIQGMPKEQYNVYAVKGNYRIEISAVVEKEEDFEQFLNSFLI